MIRFMIPRGAPNEDDHVVLSVGGRDYKIRKGVEYVVREKGEWVLGNVLQRTVTTMGGNVSLIDGHMDNESADVLFLEKSLAYAKSDKAIIDHRIEALEEALRKAREKK